MSRTAALALLAVVGVVLAGTVPASAATGSDASRVTIDGGEPAADWVLGLNGTDRVGVGTVGVDVSTALELQRSEATLRVEQIALEHRLEGAASDDERFTILRNELDSINSRLRGLYTAEQEALESYRRGDIDERTYLLETAFLDARAGHYLEIVELIDDEGARIEAAAIGREADATRTRAAVIGGPIQSSVGSAARGEGEAGRVRVEAGDAGYVLATVSGDTALRQSHRYDRRANQANSTSDLRTSLDHVYSVYPDETRQLGSISVGGQQEAGVFYVAITTSDARELRTFVDNRALAVFKEVYRRPVAQLEAETLGSVTEDDIRLGIERASSIGLLQVRTTAAGSGDPLATTVRVNETVVGSTGADGELWIVARPGVSDIAASAEANRSVTARVVSA